MANATVHQTESHIDNSALESDFTTNNTDLKPAENISSPDFQNKTIASQTDKNGDTAEQPRSTGNQCNSNLTWDQFYSTPDDNQQQRDVINPYTYQTLLSPNASYCSDSTFAVILIMSLHDHIDRRAAIRNTWGYWVRNMNINKTKSELDNKTKSAANVKYMEKLSNIKPLFVFGRHRYEAMNNQIEIEARHFGDVIQADFNENYKHLPLKNLLAYQYLHQSCKHIKYILKVDDDHFANLPVIVNMLQNKPFHGKIMGRCLGPKAVKRTRSKNAIPCNVYPLDKYPRYVNGNPGYIIASDVIIDLFTESQYLPFLPVEDVFFTGIAATKRRISLLCNPTFNPSKTKSGWYSRDAKFFQATDKETVLNIWSQLV